MAASILSVRVESQVKQSFVGLCEELGLTASTAVNLFMRQMLRERALPFRPSLGCEVACGPIDEVDKLAQAVRGIAADYPQIQSVTLFGSLARREAREDSDIDLRVLYDEDSDFGLLGLASFSAAVQEAGGRPVDIVSAGKLSDALAHAIERDGVVLYERA